MKRFYVSLAVIAVAMPVFAQTTTPEPAADLKAPGAAIALVPGVLYSNMPWTDNGGPCIGLNGVNKTGVAVLTPAGAPYQITSVLLKMHDVGGPSDFDVRVYDDAGGIWGAEVGAFGILNGGGPTYVDLEFFPTTPIELAPSTIYWIVSTVPNESGDCEAGWSFGGSAPAGIFTYVDAKQWWNGALQQRNSDITLEINGELIERFDKELTFGPDWGGEEGVPGPDGEIDLAVEVGIETPTGYDFRINYLQPDLPDVQIEDTVPAEWEVTDLTDLSMDCDYGGANKKGNNKSATKIVCWPDAGTSAGEVTVWVEARCHGKNRNQKCRPTSCGALYLNDGAEAYELDPATGEPVVDPVTGERLPPLLTSNNLCLAAVEDLNGSGIDYRGLGDEDGDLLTDYEEACGIGTDPCLEDTDDDGVRDDVDNCPLEGPADPLLGEILQPDGCLRQSQCSDGIDNEPDGNTDFPDDQSCDDILDDSEDTFCPDIVTDMDVWGYSAKGVDLRGFTNSTLHYIGCPTNGCYPEEFYCTDGPGTLQFGTTSEVALRSAVDPGDALGDIMPDASYYDGCCTSPLGLCNAPDSNNNGIGVDMVAALCSALGFANGTVLREVFNNGCPESHAVTADGLSWDSDFAFSWGHGAEYLCSD